MNCFLLTYAYQTKCCCQHFTCSSLSPEDGFAKTTQVTWWEKHSEESNPDLSFCYHVHAWHSCAHVYSSKQLCYTNTRAAGIAPWHFQEVHLEIWGSRAQAGSLHCFMPCWRTGTPRLCSWLRSCSLAPWHPALVFFCLSSAPWLSHCLSTRKEQKHFWKCKGRSRIKINIYITGENDPGRTGNVMTLCLPSSVLEQFVRDTNQNILYKSRWV